MKLVRAFLAVFIFASGAYAQIPNDSVVIKDWCPMVLSLEFSPNGDELARFCFGYAVVLLDITKFRRARTFLAETEHTPELRGFAYSPDGTMIATAEGYRGARVWYAPDPGKPMPKEGLIMVKEKSVWVEEEVYALDNPLRILQAPVRGDSNLAVSWPRFSPDGKLLITTHGHDRVKVWNTSSWSLEKELLSGPDQKLDGLSFSPNGKLLLTEHANGHVKVWNTSSWAVEEELKVSDNGLGIGAVAPDSQTVIISEVNGLLHYWNLTNKKEIRTLRTFEGPGVLSGVAFSPDGNTMIATSLLAARPVMIWNTKDWTVETESGYNSAAFSKDGKLLALGGRDHIKLVEPGSRKQIRGIELPEMTRGEVRRDDENVPNETEKLPCSVSALAFSPDGSTLVAACGYPEGTVRVVKVAP